MKPEIIRVAKGHRPLTADRVQQDLRDCFPDCETLPIDADGTAFIVRHSRFAGARIDVAPKQIRLAAKVPDTAARVIDLALLGTASATRMPKVIARLKRFLKDRYER